MVNSRRVVPAEGQESVWDYPRPPRLEPVASRLTVTLNGVLVANTIRGLRVLETSHPPVYYFPPDDIRPGVLVASEAHSWCEYKGSARYWTVAVPGEVAADAAWSYPSPEAPYQALRDHVAFYCARMQRCTVGGETARPQPGGFYGGWVTSGVVGPFKGEPGTMGW